MKEPSVATAKRLFALSGNRCAFPSCEVPLVDARSGKVTGRICHIRAAQAGGPRYDRAQSDEQRHAFENLLLLCPIHHDVVDADVEAYSVARLERMKQCHEQCQPPVAQLPEDAAKLLISLIESRTTINGSVIVNQNQMGGQVAHTITNLGPQPRHVSPLAGIELVNVLRSLPPERFDVVSVFGDIEAANLGEQLATLLVQAGWASEGTAVGGFTCIPRGLIITVSGPNPARNALLSWSRRSGIATTGEIDRSIALVRLIVGTALPAGV
jgi:hypothetical protein